MKQPVQKERVVSIRLDQKGKKLKEYINSEAYEVWRDISERDSEDSINYTNPELSNGFRIPECATDIFPGGKTIKGNPVYVSKFFKLQNLTDDVTIKFKSGEQFTLSVTD